MAETVAIDNSRQIYCLSQLHCSATLEISFNCALFIEIKDMQIGYTSNFILA